MKIVLDTNVLLYVISRKTEFYAIWEAFLSGRFQLCVTTDILNEYAEKLEEKFNPTTAFFTMKAIENSPEMLKINKYYFWKLIFTDPDDDKFVDCAVAAGADFLVTNDRHFRVLRAIPYPKIHVLSDSDFLELLTGKRVVKKNS